jgi:hypothetical protein
MIIDAGRALFGEQGLAKTIGPDRSVAIIRCLQNDFREAFELWDDLIAAGANPLVRNKAGQLPERP